MRNKKQGQTGPRNKNRDFSELGSVETEPTEKPNVTRSSRSDMAGKVENIGPAFSGRSEATPFTFGDLYALSRLAAFVIAGVSAIGTAIWWAATINGEVENLKSDVDSLDKSSRQIETQVTKHGVEIDQVRGEVTSIRMASSQPRIENPSVVSPGEAKKNVTPNQPMERTP